MPDDLSVMDENMDEGQEKLVKLKDRFEGLNNVERIRPDGKGGIEVGIRLPPSGGPEAMGDNTYLRPMSLAEAIEQGYIGIRPEEIPVIESWYLPNKEDPYAGGTSAGSEYPGFFSRLMQNFSDTDLGWGLGLGDRQPSWKDRRDRR